MQTKKKIYVAHYENDEEDEARIEEDVAEPEVKNKKKSKKEKLTW